MLRIRPLGRLMSVLLLVFAALDLSNPASCADTVIADAAQTQICAGGHAADVGHDGDACFCCSRTVRAEWLTAFDVFDGMGQPFVDRATLLVCAPATPPYHPPLL